MDNEAYFWLKVFSMCVAFILALTLVLCSFDALETKQMLDHGFVRGTIAGQPGVKWIKPDNGQCK